MIRFLDFLDIVEDSTYIKVGEEGNIKSVYCGFVKDFPYKLSQTYVSHEVSKVSIEVCEEVLCGFGITCLSIWVTKRVPQPQIVYGPEVLPLGGTYPGSIYANTKEQ